MSVAYRKKNKVRLMALKGCAASCLPAGIVALFRLNVLYSGVTFVRVRQGRKFGVVTERMQ